MTPLPSDVVKARRRPLGMISILANMSGDALTRLASTLISTPSLAPAQDELARWVMDEITGRQA